ncbi:hypothetical protein SLNWT_6607 [Streptomyces albus]|uniref:Uncharacterized protein n=1 Tax=Streptomyces albus (strain ATCC 21838 / DSM 41398 / FERM P-419 / JCM 4703 / NBRC 107858) TaxID=1081613 RepID=A0A0B5EVY9_STRA4|nr:hypothetical protein SLNWT_6607 [Streptomyces albus]AOU81287.1 hypothetical protein SLNHY_6596 [Streptomyces albus]
MNAVSCTRGSLPPIAAINAVCSTAASSCRNRRTAVTEP